MKPAEIAELQLASAVAAGRDTTVAGDLSARHFKSRKIALLWEASERLHAAGKRTGPLPLRQEAAAIMAESGNSQSITLSDLSGWASPHISDADISAASAAVIRDYRLRELASMCHSVISESRLEGADPDEISNTILQYVAGDITVDDDLLTPDDVMDAVGEDWKRRAKALKEGGHTAITTGLRDFDFNVGGGLEPGGLYVLGARPKMGKTALAMTIAIAAAESSVPVLVISLEMSTLQLGRRMIALKSDHLSLSDLKLPNQESQFTEAFRALDKIRGLPIRFRTAASSISSIVSTARKWWRTHRKTGLIVFDYLQLASGDGRQSREREVAEMSRTMKLLSLELNCATLMLSQLNRVVETRSPPRPRVADLRESGAIEQDADAIILLYRPYVYKGADGHTPLDSRENHVEVIIAANREGTPGSFDVEFIGAHTRFQDAR